MKASRLIRELECLTGDPELYISDADTSSWLPVIGVEQLNSETASIACAGYCDDGVLDMNDITLEQTA